MKHFRLKESTKGHESDLEGFDVVDATTAEPHWKRRANKQRGAKRQLFLYCPKCGKHCENYNDYDKHLLDNPSHQVFDCFQCSATGESWHDLKRHAEKAHPTEQFLASTECEGYYCHFCGSKQTSIKDLEGHIQNDHVKCVLECALCSRLYRNPQGLYNHFEIVHATINNVDFLCDWCDFHFYDPDIYALHMTKYHKVELHSLTYQCVLCDSRLKEISEFLRHVHKHGKYTLSSEEMKDGRPVSNVWYRQCFVCAKVVQDRLELIDHLTDVHFNTLICPLCNVKIKETMGLHLRDSHSMNFSAGSNLKDENGERSLPFVISKPTKNRPPNASQSNTEKICDVCYSLVPKKAFFKHMAMHKNRGTQQLKSQNPVVDTVPDESQLSFCKTCRFKVVTTFLKWHKSIHKKEMAKLPDKPRSQRPRSPRRPRKRSRSRSPRSWRSRSRSPRSRRLRSRSPRPEMKCTECDRSYDTVENLVNHVKAQHFAAALQPSPFNPYVTGMVPFGFQNPIPDVNTLVQRSSERSDRSSSRERRDYRKRFKY